MPLSVDAVPVDWGKLLTDPFWFERVRAEVAIEVLDHPLLVPGPYHGTIVKVRPCDDGRGNLWWPIQVTCNDVTLYLNLSQKGGMWQCFLFATPPGGIRATVDLADHAVLFGERVYTPEGSGAVTVTSIDGSTSVLRMADWSDDTNDHHLFYSDAGLFNNNIPWEVVGRRISLENVNAA